MLDDFIGKIKCLLGKHDWETHNFFIYNPDIKPKARTSDIKRKWFEEVIDYMTSSHPIQDEKRFRLLSTRMCFDEIGGIL